MTTEGRVDLWIEGERWNEGWWRGEDGTWHPSFKAGLRWELRRGDVVVESGIFGED